MIKLPCSQRWQAWASLSITSLGSWLSGTQVAFEVNAAGRWGDTAARFVYDFGVGTIIAFIRERARDPRGYILPVDTQYCYTISCVCSLPIRILYSNFIIGHKLQAIILYMHWLVALRLSDKSCYLKITQNCTDGWEWRSLKARLTALHGEESHARRLWAM
ncbi:hypothetical protein CLIM01_04734 [Colletotrichum limetticola]|uniref:Uncharacterized protein n=1 Tax=Colletotrichum limetticola TaxID=1209924 RepID=A0ABQ9Q2A1_9PEZI|nr:hypothetical protein CLIM01_04734 [Colletotrichum limetticola]